MFGLTTALFVTQGLDKEMIFSQNQNQTWPEIERETNHYCQMQLMGWALFFAWTNLTVTVPEKGRRCVKLIQKINYWIGFRFCGLLGPKEGENTPKTILKNGKRNNRIFAFM